MGFSLVVIRDTTGMVPNDGIVELVVTGGFSLVVAVVPNDGKLELKALVVTVVGTDDTFSFVVVGIIGLAVVVGVDILGSFEITSGNLLDDTGSFSIVTVGSITK